LYFSSGLTVFQIQAQQKALLVVGYARLKAIMMKYLFRIFLILILPSCNSPHKLQVRKSIISVAETSGLNRTLINCSNLTVFFGVDSALLQQKLPQGTIPYMKPFFPGIKKGQATIIISLIRADSSDILASPQQMMHVLVFIKPIKLTNEKDTTQFKIEAYELVRFTDSEKENNKLAALNFNVLKNKIESVSSKQDKGYSFQFSIKDSVNEFLLVKGIADNAVTFDPTHVRFWQSNENALIYSHYQFPLHHSFVGDKGQIIIRPDSYLGKLLGINSNVGLTGGTEYINSIDWVKESIHYKAVKKHSN